MKKISRFSIFAIFVAVIFALGGGFLLSSSTAPNITLSHSQTVSEISQPKVEALPAEEEVSAAAPEEEVGDWWYDTLTLHFTLDSGIDDLDFQILQPGTDVEVNYTGNVTYMASWGTYEIEHSYSVVRNDGSYTQNPIYVMVYNINPNEFNGANDSRVRMSGNTFEDGYNPECDDILTGSDNSTNILCPEGTTDVWIEVNGITTTSDATFTTNYSSINSELLTEYGDCMVMNESDYWSDGQYMYVRFNDSDNYYPRECYARDGVEYNGYTYNFDYWSPSSSGTISGDKTFKAYYTRTATSYDISYTLNGGSATNPTSYNIETATFTLSNPTRTGYTFTGWTGSNGTTAQTSVSISKGSTGNKSYTANWTAINYSITFDSNGGSSVTTKTVAYDSTYSYPTSSKDGYTFKGWAETDNATTATWTGGDKTCSGNKTWYAVWTANTYTITFDKRGGTGGSDSATATYDAAMPSITLPTKTGYTFNGYFTATGGSGTKYYNADGSSAKNYDQTAADTLYASWTANTYIVKFDSNGGSGSMSDQSFTYDVEQKLAENKFTQAGYKFLGWAKSSTMTAPDYDYEDKESVSNLTPTNGETVTLYAVWELAETTLVFNINGGDESTKHDDEVVIYGEAMPALTGIPTKTGYTFAGYMYGGVLYYDANLSSSLKWEVNAVTVTLDAQWTANEYTISYFDQGGSASTAENTLVTKHIYDIETPLTDAEKTGYTFKGFYKESDCSGEVVTKIGATETTEDITLYIKWEANTYQVEYNENNATSTEFMANSTHTYDKPQTLSPNTYERKFTVTYVFGYDGKADEVVTLTAEFGGWSTTASGAVAYLDGASVENLSAIDGDTVVLYAKFTDASITLLSPTRDSHNFTGWKLDESTTYSANQEITPTTNITLTAQWDIKTYEILYNGNGNTGGSAPISQTKEYDIDIAISGAGSLEKTGHTFAGWNTQEDGKGTTYLASANYSLNADLTLYAIWNADVYTITYLDKGGNAFSGTHESGYPTHHTYGEPTTLKSASKTGYDFKGWFITEDCTGTALTTLDVDDFTSNITLYALFEAQVYDINYKDEGGNAFSGTHDDGHPTTHTYGEETTLLGASKTGYDFAGWFRTPNCTGDAVTTLNATEFTADITLYAKWNIQSYTITLEKDEGIASVSGAGTYNYGTKVDITATPALGYAWEEWQQNGSFYRTEQSFKFEIGTQDVTFKAISSIIPYDILYDLAGGEVDGENPATYDVTSNFTLINPTKTGYTFAGWTYEESASPIMTVKITPNTIAKDLNFVANWTPNTDTVYKINYYLENLNNSDTLTTENCTLKETATLHGTTASTIQAVVKPFDGFISPTTKNVTILADGSAVVDYFYIRKTLNLSLVAGNGIESVSGAGAYEFEADVVINASLLDNYNWAQWTNKSDNSIFSQDIAPTFKMPASDLELEASAIINSITITFDDQGGTGSVGAKVYDYNARLDNLDSNDLPAKVGYNFEGYYTAKNGEGEQIYTKTGTTDKYCTFIQDTTLYAHWTGKTYLVEYDKNLPEGFVGGEYAPISNQVVFGSAYPALATFTTLPTKTAYNISFDGWALSASGEIITSETIVNTASAHTLYAQWTVTPIDYTITFSSGKGFTITASKNGANFLSGGSVNITDSVEFVITSHEGYEKASLSASGTKRTFKNNILSGVYENIEVTGSVSAIVYSITYNLNGGNASPANRSTYTIEDTFTLNNPTKIGGYDFTGWTGSNGSEKQLEVTIPAGTIGNLEYTAHYELTPAVTPIIQSQPISGQTPYGVAFELSVFAPEIDKHTLSYQWLRNGAQIDGANQSTYTTDITILAGDVSEYTVKITATREDNGLQAEVTSEIATVEVLFLDFENVQASGAYSGIYTGETRNIIATTATLGAIVEYSLDNATWQTETIDFVDATGGDVTVYWQITKENYNTASGSEIINIMQAPNGWTITPNIDGWIYGEPNAPIGSATYGEVVFTYSVSGEDNFVSQLPLSAGNYTMRAEVVETPNFEGLVKEVDFTIEQLEVTIVWGETSFTFDGTPKLPTATAVGVLDGDICEVLVSGAQTEVSEEAYTATVTGLTNTNYKLPQTNLSTQFHIYLERISGVTVEGYEGAYDKQAHGVMVFGTQLTDTIYYSLDGIDWQTEQITRTDAGITTLYVKVSRTSYADFVSEAVTISISQAILTKPTIDNTVFVYDGNEKTYNPQGFDAETMNISNNKQTAANENGYEVVVEIKDKTNYTWADATQDNLTFVFVISKMTPQMITEPTFSSVYAGQKLSAVEILGGSMSVAGEFSWESPNFTLANGENSVRLVFTPDNFENCNVWVGNATVIATQITLTFASNDDNLGYVSTQELSVDYGTVLSVSDDNLFIGGATVTALPRVFEDVFVTFTTWTNAVAGLITAPIEITANFEIAGIIASLEQRNYFSQHTNGVIGGTAAFENQTELEVRFEAGAQIVVLASPDAGYELHHWLVNGVQTPETSENTLVLIAEDEGIDIVAVFKGKQVKLNLDAGDNADLQNTNGGNKDGEYYHVGDIVEVNALAHTGFVFNNEWIHSLLGEIEGPNYTFTAADAENGEITLTAITFDEIIRVNFVIVGDGSVVVESTTWNETTKSYTIVYNSDISATFAALDRYEYSLGSIKLDDKEPTTLAPYISNGTISVGHENYKRASEITITLTFTEQTWEDYVLNNMITTQSGEGSGYKVIADFDFAGTGTKDEPYTIASADQFALLSFVINNNVAQSTEGKLGYNTAETYYVVDGQFDFSTRFWTPIGNAENPFNATIKFKEKPTGIHLTLDMQNLVGSQFDEDTIEKYNGLFGYLSTDAKVNPNEAKGNFILWLILGGALVLVALGAILPFVLKRKGAERKAAKVVNNSRTMQIQNMRNRVKYDYDYDDDDE